jgi:hypothetical protein
LGTGKNLQFPIKDVVKIICSLPAALHFSKIYRKIVIAFTLPVKAIQRKFMEDRMRGRSLFQEGFFPAWQLSAMIAMIVGTVMSVPGRIVMAAGSRAVDNCRDGSISEVHLTLKSYCFSASLPEVWHSVAHHDLICDIPILGNKWGKSALHGEKTGKIFNTNQPILKPGPARQAPIYCGSSDVVSERFFAAYYLPLIPTDLKTLKYSIFSLFFNSIGENMGNKSTQKNS